VPSGSGNGVSNVTMSNSGVLTISKTNFVTSSVFNATLNNYSPTTHTHDAYEPKWVKSTVSQTYGTITINVADHTDYRVNLGGAATVNVNVSAAADIDAFIRIENSIYYIWPEINISCPIISTNYSTWPSHKTMEHIEISIKYGYAIVCVYGT
jgi:hypothetical protein